VSRTGMDDRKKEPRRLLTSWVDGADESDWSIQNLPFGVFSHARTGRDPRIGVAIGESVLDMKALFSEGLLDDCTCAATLAQTSLNSFMSKQPAEWRAVRGRLTELLALGGADSSLHKSAGLQALCMVPRSEVTMHLPATIGDYTDFYSSREHATNVGIMFRGKDNALQPNWLHLPVGYHGRASSVVPSGSPVVRPKGQIQLDKSDPTKGTEHSACRLLDFELEVGFFVGGRTNDLGTPITMAEAEGRIFGFVLVNDWSARDIQKFEYVPLGPFGSKNFSTTISTWVVMMEALEPFRCPTSVGAQTDPVPLPYLREPNYSSFDVALDVAITPAGSESAAVVSRTNYRHMYWTCSQQLVHHAVTGCDMRAGDLLASGTISGADESAYGSMLELSWQGTKEVGPLSDGSMRKFLKDGDTVTMRGVCRHPSGYRIGFGECIGTVLPAAASPPQALAPPPAVTICDVILQSYWRSSCSWRVRVALAFYGVVYTYSAVNLLKGEQRDVSAMGQVPRLDWGDAEGVRRSLTQSVPIIEFLNEAFGGDCSLMPRDALGRARAREIAETINAGIQPLQNLSHVNTVSSAIAKSGQTSGVDGRTIAHNAIANGLAAVERLASVNRDHRYCVGAHTSIADVCLIPQLYSARRFAVDLQHFPRLLSIEKHAATQSCFQAAHPELQPDAVNITG